MEKKASRVFPSRTDVTPYKPIKKREMNQARFLVRLHDSAGLSPDARATSQASIYKRMGRFSGLQRKGSLDDSALKSNPARARKDASFNSVTLLPGETSKTTSRGRSKTTAIMA